jgi:hypothetical protein
MAAVDAISLSREGFLKCNRPTCLNLRVLLTPAALRTLDLKPVLLAWHLEEHKLVC